MSAATASTLAKSSKITARQLQRRAYVYVRQSSPKQLYHHREGRENRRDRHHARDDVALERDFLGNAGQPP